jgi:hypothetical protein
MSLIYVVKKCEANNPDKLLCAFTSNSAANKMLEQLRSTLTEISLRYYVVSIIQLHDE